MPKILQRPVTKVRTIGHEEQVKWVYLRGKGVIFDLVAPDAKAIKSRLVEEGARIHDVWFKEIGLPCIGKAFDKLKRGYVFIGDGECYVRTFDDDIETGMLPPKSFVKAFRQKFPQFKNYKLLEMCDGEPLD